MHQLQKYGISDRFINEATRYEGLKLARIVAQYKGLYKAITDDGEFLAEISGKLRYSIDALSQYPAVGDFVMVDHEAQADRAVIHHILSRKSIFLRTAVGVSGQSQAVAANVDIVFICMSLNSNYNLNRLERYLAIAWDSGATPVILLTKADLCADIPAVVAEVERVSMFSDVITTSMWEETIAEKLQGYLKPDVTAAFIGSSGVGKSTLINKLLGQDTLATKAIGKDDKGRHTTTGRQMFPCPLGGVLIDTPGMREIGVQGTEITQSFADITELEAQCRFHDCTHTTEPGCAVQKAVQEGVIDERKLENYKKLKIESGYAGLSSREIATKKAERMFKEVGGMKNVKRFLKENHDKYK